MNEYLELVNELNEHCARYYVKDAPVISDAEYDRKYAELKQMEKENPDWVVLYSPTQRVGAPVTHFSKITRTTPMLSLDNVFDEESLLKWAQKTVEAAGLENQEIQFCVEYKFDGVALELTYVNGVLYSASTRGDGHTGENVTLNIRTIQNIPLRLPLHEFNSGITTVRGEVLISKDNFIKVNKEREAQGKKPFVNARNAASGSLKHLDPAEVAKRQLTFFPYSIGIKSKDSEIPKLLTSSLTANFLLLAANRFYAGTSKLVVCDGTFDPLIEAVCDIHQQRDDIPYGIDGAVIKVNNISLHDKIGYTGHAPKWAVALKFPAQQETSVVREIICQVGRTGAVTPVAKIEPVFVGGVTVSSVTLHNAEWVHAKDIRVGDTVFVERAGDVIPAITSVVLEKRPDDSVPWIMPQKCPACANDLYKEDDGIKQFCRNPSCPAKSSTLIYHFVSRDAFDIQHCGPKVVSALIEHGLIGTVADLFTLTVDEVRAMPRFNTKSAERLVASIKASKQVDMDRFLYSLGIPGIGRRVSKMLANKYKTIEALVAASQQDFMSMPDLGPKLSQVLFNHLGYISSMADLLGSKGVQIEIEDEPVKNTVSEVEGKTFVLTGTFPEARYVYKKKIEDAGGKVSGSVSKRTNLVIYGDNPGSKVKKAQDLGVNTIHCSEFSFFN